MNNIENVLTTLCIVGLPLIGVGLIGFNSLNRYLSLKKWKKENTFETVKEVKSGRDAGSRPGGRSIK